MLQKGRLLNKVGLSSMNYSDTDGHPTLENVPFLDCDYKHFPGSTDTCDGFWK